MELIGLLIVAGCTLAITLVVWRSARSRSSLRRLLSAGPLRPLHGLKGGWVYVQGTARARQLLTAPISGATAIGYRVTVERQDARHEWIWLVDHSEVADFELHEESCAALICGDEAALLITAESPTLDHCSEAVVDLLQTYGQFTPDAAQAKRLRCTEYLLTEGQQIYVVGEATVTLARDGRLAQGESAYRATPTQLQLQGSTKRPLMLCDRRRESLFVLLGSTIGAERFVPRRLFRG